MNLLFYLMPHFMHRADYHTTLSFSFTTSLILVETGDWWNVHHIVILWESFPAKGMPANRVLKGSGLKGILNTNIKSGCMALVRSKSRKTGLPCCWIHETNLLWVAVPNFLNDSFTHCSVLDCLVNEARFRLITNIITIMPGT